MMIIDKIKAMPKADIAAGIVKTGTSLTILVMVALMICLTMTFFAPMESLCSLIPLYLDGVEVLTITELMLSVIALSLSIIVTTALLISPLVLIYIGWKLSDYVHNNLFRREAE